MGEANPAIRVRVAAVIIENGELLVLRQNGKPFWVLPGGTLEFGETLEACLVRELQEELNLTIVVDKLLYVSDFIDAAKPRQVVDTVFLARLASPIADLVMTADENLDAVAWVPLADVSALPLMPQTIAQQLMVDAAKAFSTTGAYLSV